MAWYPIKNNFYNLSIDFNCQHKERMAMLEFFISSNGFNRFSYQLSWNLKKVLDTGQNTCLKRVEKSLPPYRDHDRLFKNTKTGLICFVSQPYLDYDFSNKSLECKDWAKKNKIKIEIYDSSYSWYNSITNLIIYSNMNSKIKVKKN
jgi:hypothetical protein